MVSACNFSTQEADQGMVALACNLCTQEAGLGMAALACNLSTQETGLGMVAPACDLSTWETEAWSIWIWEEPGLHIKILSETEPNQPFQ